MRIALLFALLAASVALELLAGAANIFEMDSESALKLLMLGRLPRCILAVLVGASLAASGCAMQAFFRNPLADPYVLGVSSGASVGAAMVVALGYATTLNLTLAAFVASLLTVFAVYRIGGSQSYSILLAGLAVASFLSGLTTLVVYFSQNSLHEVFFWIMGSFSRASWEKVTIVATAFAVGATYLLANSWNLNAILLGDEHARAVGVNVDRFRKEIIAVVSLLTSACVACCGVIGFVGIIVPHTMRLIFGEAHQRLLPASLIFGMTLMPVVDVLARTATTGELPVGALTALIGSPFFVYVLRRGI
ncbi:MAG: iron ABC transporter permease [Archaeoglobaceae archaeon]